MDTITHTMTNLLNSYRTMENVEIECRFGWKPKKEFVTDIGEKFYKSIMETMDTSSVCKKSTEDTDVYVNKTTRVITKGDTKEIIKVEQKKKIKFMDFALDGTPFDLRLSVCQEIKKPKKINLQKYERIRNKLRTSYVYKMWSYDVTRVTRYEHDNIIDTVYECELELLLGELSDEHTNEYLAESCSLKLNDIIQMSVGDFEKIHLKTCRLT